MAENRCYNSFNEFVSVMFNGDKILLEGGSIVNYAALQAGIDNRIEAHVAPKFFRGTGLSKGYQMNGGIRV